MLGLKLETDPRWANIAISNLPRILSDHAWCEQKAASNAITLITMNPDKPELVKVLTEIAIEELDHFRQVHEIILKRGFELQREEKDDYVNQLRKFTKKGEGDEVAFVERMLFAAMIEARSCERFKVLSSQISDKELATFYNELMVSEANHYTTFLKYAKKYASAELVQKRWQEWLEFESNLIRSYGKEETIHG